MMSRLFPILKRNSLARRIVLRNAGMPPLIAVIQEIVRRVRRASRAAGTGRVPAGKRIFPARQTVRLRFAGNRVLIAPGNAAFVRRVLPVAGMESVMKTLFPARRTARLFAGILCLTAPRPATVCRARRASRAAVTWFAPILPDMSKLIAAAGARLPVRLTARPDAVTLSVMPVSVKTVLIVCRIAVPCAGMERVIIPGRKIVTRVLAIAVGVTGRPGPAAPVTAPAARVAVPPGHATGRSIVRILPGQL